MMKKFQDLRDTKEEKGKNRVIDWFSVRSGCNHDVDHLGGS